MAYRVKTGLVLAAAVVWLGGAMGRYGHDRLPGAPAAVSERDGVVNRGLIVGAS